MQTKTAIILALAAVLIMVACKKTKSVTAPSPLVGSWQLQQTNVYEVAGKDSLGQMICNLIQNIQYRCQTALQFKSNNTGTGYVNVCDSLLNFNWKMQGKDTVLVNNKAFGILYVTKDSLAFYYNYTRDILKLKNVVYYTKTK